MKVILKTMSIFLILFFLSLDVSYAQECDFVSGTCERFSTSFMTFNLNFDNEEVLDYFEAEIYNKDNPNNKIRLETNKILKSVKNLNPFMEVGVYIIKIRAFNLAGDIFETSDEFIFDNSQILSPSIPLNLQSDTNTVNLNAKVLYKDLSIIAKKADNTVISSVKSSDNGFFSMNLNLDNGLNYVKFQVINRNGIGSEILERLIIAGGKFDFNKGNFVSNVNIDLNLHLYNKRTIKNQDGSYTSSKRNFYILGSGSGLKGAEIYVNGVPAKFDGSKYGAFILLNEGKNILKVKSLNNEKTVVVYYSDYKFIFQNLNFKKFISNSNEIFSGEVNYNLPFNLYLNGEYLKSVVPSNGQFSFSFNSHTNLLKNGKNYIYLEAENNQRINKVFYYDISAPEINVLNFEKSLNTSSFVFEVSDDIGVDFSQIEVIFDSANSINKNFIDIRGNLLRVDISSLSPVIHNYQIIIKDFTGKQKSIGGSLNLLEENTILKSFNIENGYDFGNYLFVKSGPQQLSITPSEKIIFKNIYLDGVDIIDYIIFDSGEILINLDFKKNLQGDLEFRFYNFDKNEEFVEKYNYISSIEKPNLNLDYIYHSETLAENSIFVSGEILDSHFDWDSLDLGQGIVNRIGNYFEAFIQLENIGTNNLHVSGNDFSNNGFLDLNYFYSIFYLDGSKSELFLSNDNYFKDEITASLSNSIDRTKKKIYSYDGFSSLGNIINPNSFYLPVHERYGLRVINLKGFETSDALFSSSKEFIIDPLKPEIYFVLDLNGDYIILIDGTLSDIENVRIEVDDNLAITSSCNYQISITSRCYKIENSLVSQNKIEVEVSDRSGNYNNKNLSISSLDSFNSIVDLSENNLNSLALDFYFNGNNLINTQSDLFIQGQIISKTPIKSVKLEGVDCKFDDFNFICYPLDNFNSGFNTVLNIVVENLAGSSKTKNVIIFSLYNENTVNIDQDNDLDNDGINNGLDLDDDGDGILDDGDFDNDNDNKPDNIDLDDDNDGILDIFDSDTNDELLDPFTIIVNSGLSVSLDEIYGDLLFDLQTNYLLVDDELSINGSVDEDAIISVLIGGEERLVGFKNGNFNLNIDLSTQVNAKEDDEFQIWLKGEDEDGNIAFSRKINIVYDRVVETLFSIIFT